MTTRGNGSWRHNDTTLMQYSNNRNTGTTVHPNGAAPQTSTWVYDADGQRAKRVEQTQVYSGPYTFKTTYYVRSSVLGGKIIAELNEGGVKRKTYIYASGAVLAQEENGQARWVHSEPVTNSLRETTAGGYFASRQEFDPLGNDAPLEDPAPAEDPTPDYLYPGSDDSSGTCRQRVGVCVGACEGASAATFKRLARGAEAG